jgi:hypothetical protein
MSGSPSTSSRTSRRTSAPSGSSSALPPARTNRILEAIEARHLDEQRLAAVDVKRGQAAIDLRDPHLGVLVGQRIDRRWDQELRVVERTRERRQGEHAGVVAPDPLMQELPHRTVGAGRVDVAAPDPRADLRGERDQGCRLGVVDRDDVGIVERQARRIPLVRGSVRLALLHRQIGLPSLQRVVHPLGRDEELGSADDHLPADAEAQLGEQRHVPLEELRHAAADAGRVDDDEAQAVEAGRQAPQHVDPPLAHDFGVGIEAGAFAHAVTSALKRATMRCRSSSRLNR